MAYTTINKSTDHFNTKLFTGNAASNAITGVGFQPDWVWSKSRNQTSHHLLYDAVRGVQKFIQSSTNNAESTNANTLTAFDSDGMTFNSADNGNASGSNGVAWCWKAGTTGSGTTSGSGTGKAYSYSVNTTAGFSIVKYLGNGTGGHTIPHHLGAVPKAIFVKSLGSSDSWRLYHASLGATKFLSLNSTNTTGTNSVEWNDTTPTSSVFSVGSGTNTNTNDQNYIAYCFAEKTGYSKFGSYTGNGSSSSPAFIYTGFKPKFVIVKCTNEADAWFLHDDKRDGYNDDNEYLFPNLTNVEGTNTNRIRFLSNGFSVPTTDKSHNKSGNSYIYIAFGQSIVGTNNIPAVAR